MTFYGKKSYYKKPSAYGIPAARDTGPDLWKCDDKDFTDARLAELKDTKKTLILLAPSHMFTIAAAILLLRLADKSLTYADALQRYGNSDVFIKVEGFNNGKGKNLSLQEIRCRIASFDVAMSAKLDAFIKSKSLYFDEDFIPVGDCRNCPAKIKKTCAPETQRQYGN